MGRRWRGGYNDFEWDYYSENRPRKVENGIKAKSERGTIGETWWSQRWVGVLESFGMGTRLTRGRSYARKGQVLSIDIEAGLVKAKVQGSMEKPYVIKIRLQPLSRQEWEQVIGAMASQALFAAKLLAGEMPKNIEEAFDSVNLSLFPETEEDLQTSCTCPDWANPCKHIAAVYYILAERFDEDPFLLFKLRGRDRETIVSTLRAKRVEKLDATSKSEKASNMKQEQRKAVPQEEPSLRLEDQLHAFWQAGEALDTFAINPVAPDIENAILKRLGDAPFAVGGKNCSQLLEKAYNEVHSIISRRITE